MSKPSPSKVDWNKKENPDEDQDQQQEDNEPEDDSNYEEEVQDLHAHLNVDVSILLKQLTQSHTLHEKGTTTIASYIHTRSSDLYETAKSLLNEDAFESALSLIETGLSTLASLGFDELHPALGPLYYLYGTTLLYSVEESQVDDEHVMMMMNDGGNENANHGEDGGAGDLQIAWENLEAARKVISQLPTMESKDKSNNQDHDEHSKLILLDLAQIHTRLADLSRHEGHYQNSLEDLHQAKKLREQVLTGKDEKWDRRIADVEYNLAMTALLLASEGEKHAMGGEGEEDHNDVNDNDESHILSMDEISALREKALCHYVQCARIFAGIIGTCCNVDPVVLAEADESLVYQDDAKIASSKMDDGEDGKKGSSAVVPSTIQNRASKALTILRSRVAPLQASQEENQDKVHDMKELLDEIQETIDNCEQDREGLRDVVNMKKQAEQDIRKSDEVAGRPSFSSSTEPNDNGITTIGFGSRSTMTGATTEPLPISMISSTSSSAAPTMMVVKKKKKLEPFTDEMTVESHKMAKTETND